MTTDPNNILWTNEKVEKLPAGNWLYKLACFLLGKKRLTYQELYLISFGMKKKKITEDKAKDISINAIIRIYEYNNGKLPPGVRKNY